MANQENRERIAAAGNNMFDGKKILIHGGAIILCWIITALFFSPLFGGKEMIQSDIESHKGMTQSIVEHREKMNEEPLWSDAMFSGMPAYQISVIYPNNLVNKITKGFTYIMPHPATIIFLCMIGFYFLLLAFKVDPWVAIIGAIGFGLSSYFVILLPAGHNSKGFAIAYMAPVLMGMLLTFRGKLWLGGALTTLALALELEAGHLQITYYLAMMIGFVAIGETIRLFVQRESKKLMYIAPVLVIAVGFAIIPNMGSLLLTNEYVKVSNRGGSDITITPDGKAKNASQKAEDGLPIGYATGWSYSAPETMTLLIPDFYGGASTAIMAYDESAVEDIQDKTIRDYVGQGFGAYFGDQPGTSGPVYVGAIICVLFLLGMFIVKDNIKWWLLGVTVLTVVLSWGLNAGGFFEWFFNNVPGFNKFRSVSMMLVIAEFTMPLIGVLAIQELIRNREEWQKKMIFLYIPVGFLALICLAVAVSPDSFVTPVSDSEMKDIATSLQQQQVPADMISTIQGELEHARLSLVTGDAWRSFFFIAAAGIMLILFTLMKGIHQYVLCGVLGVLVLADLYPVDKRYCSTKQFPPSKDRNISGDYRKKVKGGTKQDATPADLGILADTDPNYRVLNMTADVTQDARSSYFHKSIGGYHPAKIRRYQELQEFYILKEMQQIREGLGQGATDSSIRVMLSNLHVLNMLNTKYIIYNPGAENGFITNRYANGNAWFVSSIKTVPDANSEILALKDINPRYTAVIGNDFAKNVEGLVLKADSTAQIKLTSYKINDLVYESNAASEQLAVFSEIYYTPGWDAFIDDKPAEHFRADYVMRALRVPAGKHKIEFKFQPKTYKTSNTISLVGSLGILLVLAGGIWMQMRADRKNANKAA